MGWSNYIIIPKLKLIIEVSRNIGESRDYQHKALDYLTSEDRIFDIDEEQEMSKILIQDVTIKDISLLYFIYDQANKISEMEPDRFLLYWLESKNIDYKILSEFEIGDKIEEYKKTHTILRIFNESEGKE